MCMGPGVVDKVGKMVRRISRGIEGRGAVGGRGKGTHGMLWQKLEDLKARIRTKGDVPGQGI